jgi:hypothetical protein
MRHTRVSPRNQYDRLPDLANDLVRRLHRKISGLSVHDGGVRQELAARVAGQKPVAPSRMHSSNHSRLHFAITSACL